MRSCIELRNVVSLSSLYLTIHTTIDTIVISNSLLPIDVNNTIHTIHTTTIDAIVISNTIHTIHTTIVDTIHTTTIHTTIVDTTTVDTTVVNTIVVIV